MVKRKSISLLFCHTSYVKPKLHMHWPEVSSCALHLLHNGLSDSPIRWRCHL